MKKLLFTSLLVLAAIVARAQTFTVDGLSFTVTDAEKKTVSVSKTDATPAVLVIPSSVTNDDVTYSVTSVPQDAFSGTALTSLTIPASVTSLGDYCFAHCASLAEIRIEDSETALQLNTVNPGWWYGPFYWSDAGKTVYIGRPLTFLNDETYAPFSNITSVVIAGSMTTINPNLFEGIGTLSSITMGDNVTAIGAYAFKNAGTADGVEELTLTMGSKVETIAAEAFYGCTKLKTVTLPNTLATIDCSAFRSTGLTSLSIPASVTSLGDYCFVECASLAEIRIEDSETALQLNTVNPGWWYGPFYWSDAGKTVYIGRPLTFLNDETYAPFSNITSVVIAGSMTTINPNLFDGIGTLSSITMGDNVTAIGERAFKNAGTAEGVEELTLTMGSKVETIAAEAFNGCSKLKTVTLPNTLTTIGQYAFSGSGLTSLSIPASVTSLGDYCFAYCASLAEIRIEDSVKDLQLNTVNPGWWYGPFYNSDAGKTVYIGRPLTFLNDDTYAPFSNITSVEIAGNITTIANDMFNDVTTLSSITIGSNVTAIGKRAFRNASTADGVEELTLTMGSKVETIAAEAFNGCTKLKTVTLPNTLTFIDCDAFSGTALTSLTIPASVTTLGDYCFANCASLAEIRIEDSETALQLNTANSGYWYGTFYNSDANKTVYIGRPLTFLNDDTYAPFGGTTSVEFGSQVTTINSSLFSSSTLTSVEVPWLTDPTALPADAFNADTYSGATLWVPGGTKSIYEAADNWKSFTNIDFASYVVSITGSAHGTLSVGELSSTGGVAQTTLIDRETEVVFTPTPDKGYEVTTFSVNEESKTLTDGKYTISSLLADQTVTAGFTPITYNITYDLAGGAVATANPATYNIETATFTLNNPTKAGYTFAGWTGTDLEAATATVTIATGSTENRNYVATWTPITYSIAYDLDGGSVATANPESYTIESAAITLNNPTKTGYTFAGWTGTDLEAATKTVTIAKGSMENRSYVATWTPITYSIAYDLDGGTVAEANPATYTIESEAITLNNPTKEGYTFTGWTGTGLEAATIAVTIAKGSVENRSYVATWQINQYTITFDTDGGSDIEPITQDYNTAITPPTNPTKEGYDFTGWTPAIPETMPAENITVKAGWKDNGTTEIRNIELPEGAKDRVYNLNGQKVEIKSKGLYIINGRKVVVK